VRRLVDDQPPVERAATFTAHLQGPLQGGAVYGERRHAGQGLGWCRALPNHLAAATVPDMSALAFDTLAYARRMEAVGFSRAQAEALAEEQAKLIDDRLATKLDLEALRLATKKDLDALSLTTKADLEAHRLATKADLDALSLTTKADLETYRLATKADLEALSLTTKADLEAYRLATKADLEALSLTTKADLDAHRITTKADLDSLRNSLEKSIAEGKAETLKWIVGTVGLQTVVILGAALALAKMAAH
jgi:hypothetical protein